MEWKGLRAHIVVKALNLHSTMLKSNNLRPFHGQRIPGPWVTSEPRLAVGPGPGQNPSQGDAPAVAAGPAEQARRHPNVQARADHG